MNIIENFLLEKVKEKGIVQYIFSYKYEMEKIELLQEIKINAEQICIQIINNKHLKDAEPPLEIEKYNRKLIGVDSFIKLPKSIIIERAISMEFQVGTDDTFKQHKYYDIIYNSYYHIRQFYESLYDNYYSDIYNLRMKNLELCIKFEHEFGEEYLNKINKISNDMFDDIFYTPDDEVSDYI